MPVWYEGECLPHILLDDEFVLDVVESDDKPAIAAMHGPRSVFDIGHSIYTVMQEVCRCLTNEKQRKTDIRFTDQLLDVSSNR